MPRQTFLARESFVDAAEALTRTTLFTIPAYINYIRLVAENKKIDSVRFSYEKADKNKVYFIDVTVLPLNDQYTRVSLHATHTTGSAFYEDADMAYALHDFESAIHAAVKGDLSHYHPKPVRVQENRFALLMAALKASVLGLLPLRN